MDQQAVYYLSEPTVAVTSTWMLLHGYGQLAEDFSSKFENLKEDGVVCIYPEGLSHFYLKRGFGKVGASWMTSENRTIEIANTLSYLRKILTIHQDTSVLLGFSQGAETASRLALYSEIKVLVLWGGKLAAECFDNKAIEKLRKIQIYSVRGEGDLIFDFEQQQDFKRSCLAFGLRVECLEFEGGHEIKPETVHILSRKIIV